MQMLWIGCVESDEEFCIKAQKGCTLASAQVSQKNLIAGMEQVSGCVFDSINGSVLPPYPVYQDRDVPEVCWSHAPGAWDISVGYRNDKYINRIHCKNAMITAADQWIKNRYLGGELKILVYSMRSAPMATACYLKGKITNAKLYLIVTDLPQFMDLGQSKVKALLKKIDWISIKRMQKCFDGFILYAAKMAEFLKIPQEKWMLMEGSYDGNTQQDKAEKSEKKALMYSGTLDERYGIPMLLDAFMGIEDPDIQLWFTGGGNAETYIRECAQKDPRIKFFGFLPSRQDVLRLQNKASALINMRLPSEPASDYCFPSKLFEYMVTGIPVLSFKTGGIPEEYDPYLIIMQEETILSIRNAIDEVSQMDPIERTTLGIAAKNFICQNKTALNQSTRIIDWISGVKNIEE